MGRAPRTPWRRGFVRALACALGLGLGLGAPVLPGLTSAQAQEADFATLLADQLYLDGPNRLIAQGNVEAFFENARLSAARIVYDRATGAMQIEGPIVLTEGTRAVILADSAELREGLRLGLIRSARVVLDQQLQIAANTVERRSERFTEMNNVVASACEICPERNTPLWEVRADRVVHDTQERQLYFEGARFRMFGLPVAYIPRLRIPDPSLERATGFLSPRFSLDSDHGVGLRAPYFIALSADKDLTLTPFLGTKGTYALEARYRQAFSNGLLELGGLIARDSIRQGELRGMVYAKGDFAVPRGYTLSFNLIQPSDRSLLEDYDRGEPRLTSDITLERVRRDERIRVQALQFRSLRLGDVNANLPNSVGQGLYDRRFDMPGVGGTGRIRLEAEGYSRRSPLAADPKRVARFSADLTWRRDTILPGGVLGAIGGNLGFDHFRIGAAASGFAPTVSRWRPSLMAELRWPLVRATAGGASHVIEPVAQLIWSNDRTYVLPNATSRMPELDEGNLFTFDRFAGGDAREAGLRANLGLSWTRYDPNGWSSTVTVGRIVRDRDLGQFSPASPLAGKQSDWLLAASVDTAAGLSLSSRSLFSEDFNLTRSAIELDWTAADFGISTSYMRIEADPFENRAVDASEWTFDGSRALDEYWTARVGWRYDIASRRAARTSVGLDYENECLRMAMMIEREYSATTNSNSTRFGLNIDILGIGGNPSITRKRCSDGL
ncbi:LPS-assembly protein LptD [Roseibaca sp. Y0-43]|uniref:LPS-assembly protein LptD n=1 Tax=Roseibaca sp. Y0-43 TaxID=2816854 RepID=UPI001D0C24D4|nr:LPS assembly protein LptD [Roseibaca sp. Y0-43]MCC1480101.1 LPS-assembly protein LptD [Roseibaca sp. Y0-43]